MAERNIDLLCKIRDQISRHPDQHRQAWWLRFPDDAVADSPAEALERVHPKDGEFTCLTTACIAGWAVVLSPRKKVLALAAAQFSWAATGQQLLGLDPYEADALFHNSNTEEARDLLDALIEGEDIV